MQLSQRVCGRRTRTPNTGPAKGLWWQLAAAVEWGAPRWPCRSALFWLITLDSKILDIRGLVNPGNLHLPPLQRANLFGKSWWKPFTDFLKSPKIYAYVLLLVGELLKWFRRLFEELLWALYRLVVKKKLLNKYVCLGNKGVHRDIWSEYIGFSPFLVGNVLVKQNSTTAIPLASCLFLPRRWSGLNNNATKTTHASFWWGYWFLPECAKLLACLPATNTYVTDFMGDERSREMKC